MMIAALLDYSQPVIFGVLAWVDCIVGWRPGRDDAYQEPDPIG